MNNFSLVGKFQQTTTLNKSNSQLILQTTSPYQKKINLPISIINEPLIDKIKKNDLLGIKGFIDNDQGQITLVASKIIWLSNNK